MYALMLGKFGLLGMLEVRCKLGMSDEKKGVLTTKSRPTAVLEECFEDLCNTTSS
jgi:hypothetical protein